MPGRKRVEPWYEQGNPEQLRELHRMLERLKLVGVAQDRDVRQELPMFSPTLFHFFSNFWLMLANFERPVLGCIEADPCEQIVNTRLNSSFERS